MVVLFLLLLGLSVPLMKSSEVSYQCGMTTAGWSIPPTPEDVNLKQVIAIIRHGDRTSWNGSECWPGDDGFWSCDLVHGQIPININSNNRGNTGRIFEKIFMPTNEVMNGNCSVGQLTTIGYSQHLSNGRSLNSAYVKTGFLSPSLDPSEVYIRSDDVPRTILSAQSLIEGMFPQDCDNNGDHCSQLVPLYTRDLMYDNMEANGVLCPKFEEYQTKFYTSKEWLDHLNITMSIINNISKTIGFNISDNFNHFCDCIITHHCHNFSWPDRLTEDLAELALNEFTWEFYNSLKYPSIEENSKAGIGFLLKDIWKNFNQSVKGEDYQKFSLYSAHDTTLIQLLVALQLDEELWPPYSSMMLLELYSTSTTPAAIRVLYNGKIKTFSFCNGQELCNYETFSQYMSTVTPPDNYQEYCQM